MANGQQTRTLGLMPRLNLPTLMDWEDFFMMPNIPGGVSVYEDDKNVYVEAALPGVNPKDIDATMSKGVLTVKGEAKTAENEKKRKYYRRASQSYSYRVAIPGEINEKAEPEATFNNGIVTIKIAKAAQAQPKKIAVKAGK